MIRIVALFIAGIVIVTALPAAAKEFSAAQKSELEALVRNYIVNNPEVLIESLEGYREKQQVALQAQQGQKLTEHKEFLRSTAAPSAGNPDGNLTVVEFFDYNCGYCKRAVDEVKKLISEDKNVRVVFLDMPILSETSMEVSKWAMAAHNQGKYFEYHVALMEHQGAKNTDILRELAKKAGLNVKQLEKDKDSPEIAEKIGKNLQVAHDLGINGTPGFVIGEEIVPGYITYPQMKAIVEKARQDAAGG